MRRIVTAITAATLALGLVAQAVPAAAVTGYDSAYAGESAFLTLNPGQSGTFTVFFANTGTTTWTKGTATQVDLLACLEDKVTCDQQDAREAPFNSGWLSATRYATTTQTSVAPGQIGTFTYNVAVPTGASGLYRFNGDVAVASLGAAGRIHPEGYFQDVNVPGAAPAPTGAITVTPTDKAINIASTAAGTANENRGIRQYTATLGTGVTAPVRIFVYSATCVSGPDASGKFTLDDSNGDRHADDDCGTAADVFIQEVNGLSIGGNQTNVEASPPSGSSTITFSLNYRGTSNRQVKPIVFKDADGDTLVDVDTKPCCGAADTNIQARTVTGAGQNTEAMGVGGEKDWTQPAATLGTFSCAVGATATASRDDTNQGRVRFVDTAAGYVQVEYAGTQSRFNFDSNDTFFYVNTSQDSTVSFGAAGPGITLDTFKSYVSSRDRLTINYNPDAAAASSFTFCADRPTRPSSATAAVTDAPTTTGSLLAQQRENCTAATPNSSTAAAGDCTSGTADNTSAQTSTAIGNTEEGGTDVNDVSITFPISVNPCVKSYFVVRQISSDAGINWQQTQVVSGNARIVNATDTTVTVYDIEVPAGFHRWGVVSRVDDIDTTGANTLDCGNKAIDNTAATDATGSSRSGSTVRYSNTLTTTVPSGATSGAPQSNDMFVSTSGGLTGQLDTGDVFKIVFNQVMTTDSAGKLIQYKDSDGTTMILRCDAAASPAAGEYGAVCNFNAVSETVKGTAYVAGRVATVTVVSTNPPAATSASAGTTPGMQYPTTAVDQGGWTSAVNGLNWDIPSSPDKTLEQP